MSAIRTVVREHLRRGDLAAVRALAVGEAGLARAIVSLLYDPDPLLRWRAVSAVGELAAAAPERARPLVTRLLWTLNDESGGIGWMSAPALGEIGRNAPALLRDGVRVVVHYLEDPTLLPGVLWAVGRLAPAYPAETREVVPELVGLLGGADPEVRGQAARALGLIGDRSAAAGLGRLAEDAAPATVYEGGELVTREVRSWAHEALGVLGASPA